ncbi:hypothetical protein GCK72_016594 [Caenorhabditis remanei]|uniref:F-box domain-containing protein n=1 Tax=Caenorhabditis remanei TaxID=31234 RepID=A0A6A5G6C4_CAERE|nr:hypothetical protein GCK72_016594 [Caenorhabditis remanei]KAF1750049.1 hypothetical protein GCK72_016594 [Caenorhabditis remanei]
MFDMRKKVKPMQLFGIGSMISLCRWKNSQYDSSKYEYESSQEQTTVAKAVHSYLYQFFGSHAVYQVFSCIRPPSLEKIDRTHIRVPENTTAEELEACFTASPNQEFIQLNGYFNGNLCPNSAILGAEHLTVISNKGHGDEILLGFRGKRLECSGPFHDATIVQFLNEWKSNRGFHNLESLIINSSDYKNYDRGDIIKNMDVKQLDRPEDILQITWEMSHSCSYSMFSTVPPKSTPSGFRSRDYLIRDEVTMKLLKFPSLVLQNIFGLIELHNLLVLSFCSKRTRYLIQSLQRYQWMNIKFVRYTFEWEDKIWVWVRLGNKFEGFSLSPTTLEETVITPMEVFGMGPEVPICFHSEGNYIYDKDQKHLVVHGIHDYLYQFFGSSSIDYEIKTENELPPSLKNIHKTSIKVPENTTAEELEACFAASPNQEYIEIDGNFDGNLSANSVIYGAKHLRVFFEGDHGDEILLRFKGIRLQFHSANFHDSTICQFLKEWKSNQGFQNLKSLMINSSDYKNYDAAELLEDIDVRQLDHPDYILHINWRMSISFPSAMMVGCFPLKSFPSSFESRDYLIRDDDGEKASVFIEDDDVRIALWNGNSCEMENLNS